MSESQPIVQQETAEEKAARYRKLGEQFSQHVQAKGAELQQAREDRKKANEAALQAAKPSSIVESGQTTITREGQSAAKAENEVKQTGEEYVGRNPEDVVAGEKRSDWDPNKG